MNKTTFLLMALVISISLCSCTGQRSGKGVYNGANGISLSVSPYSYSVAPETISLQITNHSNETAQFGAGYSFEKYSNNRWEVINLPEFAVISIMYMLQPGDSQNYDINLFSDQNYYSPGRYRLVKDIYMDSTGNRKYYGEFEIAR